jgi:hypothetical protein
VEEIFYEDILETFLFCFIASLGIIQIMVARRGWHGLSLYGGRVRPAVNNVMGAALLVFAYAWYFSDPLHRNVRNIEAFMSLLCLVLGIATASAATAIVASTAEALRRRLGRGREGRDKAAGSLERLDLPAGTVLVSKAWGGQGENLVVVAEPGRGSQNLARSLYAALPDGHAMLSLHPAGTIGDPEARSHSAAEGDIRDLLAQAEHERGIDLRGETFLGLGWGANALGLLGHDLESAYQPCRLLLVAPVVPDYHNGFAGDALLSDTPIDVLATLSERKPWKDDDFLRILRMWLPVLVACVVMATAVTVAFDVRWKLFSGPMTGLLLSLWVTYFLIRWRRAGSPESRESRLVSRLCGPAPGDGGIAFTMVLTSGDAAALATLPSQAWLSRESIHRELWEDVLRGKFILSEGTPGRLATLIWEETPGYEEQ